MGSPTSQEFELPSIHFQIGGHTAPSKKSTDGGKGTSQARALEVCHYLSRDPQIERSSLHAVGWGSSKPPASGDPRRVEIIVLDGTGLRELRNRRGSGAEVIS